MKSFNNDDPRLVGIQALMIVIMMVDPFAFLRIFHSLHPARSLTIFWYSYEQA